MKATVRPGQRVVQMDDEPTAVLIYDGVPDWVTLPAPLGGHRANVVRGERGVCPDMCGAESLILVLDAKHNGKTLRVAECPRQGWLWHTTEKVR